MHVLLPQSPMGHPDFVIPSSAVDPADVELASKQKATMSSLASSHRVPSSTKGIKLEKKPVETKLAEPKKTSEPKAEPASQSSSGLLRPLSPIKVLNVLYWVIWCSQSQRVMY